MEIVVAVVVLCMFVSIQFPTARAQTTETIEAPVTVVAPKTEAVEAKVVSPETVAANTSRSVRAELIAIGSSVLAGIMFIGGGVLLYYNLKRGRRDDMRTRTDDRAKEIADLLALQLDKIFERRNATTATKSEVQVVDKRVEALEKMCAIISDTNAKMMERLGEMSGYMKAMAERKESSTR